MAEEHGVGVAPVEAPKILVNDEERQQLLSFVDRDSALKTTMNDAVMGVVEGQTKLKREMREYWVGIKKKYKLSTEVNYLMDKVSGMLIPQIPKTIKPDKPQPEKGE